MREADDAWDRREPSYLPNQHNASWQCLGRQHRHQLPWHLLHALSPRRLHRRYLSRQVPHNSHLQCCPGHGGYDLDHIHCGAGASATSMCGERDVCCGHGSATGRAVPGTVPDCARYGRPEVERVRFRFGPVRRIGPGREEADDEVLQLVLLLHQPRLVAGSDGARLYSGQRREEVGLRDLCCRYRRWSGSVHLRDETVPVQEADRESADTDCRGGGGGLAEEGDRDAIGSHLPLRWWRRQGGK